MRTSAARRAPVRPPAAVSMPPGPAGASRPARLRAARASDLDRLATFISSYTADGTLLPRTRPDLERHIGDFRLAIHDGAIVGCGALHPSGVRLAEIRSLAVDPSWRGLGIGRRIVRALLSEARRRGLARVFCLTRRPGFFEREGFVEVPKERFPQKVWNDCRLCPRLHCCDEIAMERAISWFQRQRAPLW